MAKEAIKDSREKIKDDISLLRQLIGSLEESEKKLEEFYKENNPENLNRAKKFITKIHDKISEISK